MTGDWPTASSSSRGGGRRPARAWPTGRHRAAARRRCWVSCWRGCRCRGGADAEGERAAATRRRPVSRERCRGDDALDRTRPPEAEPRSRRLTILSLTRRLRRRPSAAVGLVEGEAQRLHLLDAARRRRRSSPPSSSASSASHRELDRRGPPPRRGGRRAGGAGAGVAEDPVHPLGGGDWARRASAVRSRLASPGRGCVAIASTRWQLGQRSPSLSIWRRASLQALAPPGDPPGLLDARLELLADLDQPSRSGPARDRRRPASEAGLGLQGLLDGCATAPAARTDRCGRARRWRAMRDGDPRPARRGATPTATAGRRCSASPARGSRGRRRRPPARIAAGRPCPATHGVTGEQPGRTGSEVAR